MNPDQSSCQKSLTVVEVLSFVLMTSTVVIINNWLHLVQDQLTSDNWTKNGVGVVAPFIGKHVSVILELNLDKENKFGVGEECQVLNLLQSCFPVGKLGPVEPEKGD